MTEQTRRCSKCQRELPLSRFYRNDRRGRIEYRAECKDCKNLNLTAWRQKNRKHYNAYQRGYSKSYRQARGDPTHPERAKRWALRRALKLVEAERD